MFEGTRRFKSSRLPSLIWKQKRGILFLTFLTTSLACFQAWMVSPLYKSAVVVNIKPLQIAPPETYRTNRQIVLSLYEKMGDVLSAPSLQILIKDNNLFKNEPAELKELSERITERLEISRITMEANRVSAFRLAYVDRSAENAEAVINALAGKLVGSAENVNREMNALSYRNEPQTTVYPQRWLVIGVGFFGGFLLSLAIAAVIGLVNCRKSTA